MHAAARRHVHRRVAVLFVRLFFLLRWLVFFLRVSHAAVGSTRHAQTHNRSTQRTQVMLTSALHSLTRYLTASAWPCAAASISAVPSAPTCCLPVRGGGVVARVRFQRHVGACCCAAPLAFLRELLPAAWGGGGAVTVCEKKPTHATHPVDVRAAAHERLHDVDVAALGRHLQRALFVLCVLRRGLFFGRGGGG